MKLPLADTRYLQQVGLFQNLSPAELVTVLELAHRCPARRSEFFFHQDDPAQTLYVLIEGQVKMTQAGPEGQQVLLRLLKPGEDFGAIAVLTGTPYPLSAQALEDSLALAWDEEVIRCLLTQYPALALNALRLIANRYRQLQERYRELATERVERRVAHALLRLVQQAGRPVEDGLMIELSLSRQNLAEMTGTTLYSVSRLLSLWEQQDLVETGREWVKIRSLAGLLAVVNQTLSSPLEGEPVV